MKENVTISGWPDAAKHDIGGGLIGVPCSLFRGATSKGPVFLASDLPEDEEIRNRFLVAALNPEHPGQIDGVGGAEHLSNKVLVLSKSLRPNTDIDYTFLQLTPGSTRVDGIGNSVNMGTSIGPYVIDKGLVEASGDETEVRIFAVNSQMAYSSIVQTPNGMLTYAGDTAIDGVSGTAAPVTLTYRPPFGNVFGALFPTGQRRNVVNGIPFTVVEAGGAVCVIFRADSFGRTAYETKKDLDADDELAVLMEPLREEAGRMIGLNGYPDCSTPDCIIVAPAREGGSLAARKLQVQPGASARCHSAFSGSGGVCLAMGSILSGTVGSEVVSLKSAGQNIDFQIEHPSGSLTIKVDKSDSDADDSVASLSILRTSRKLFDGKVYVALKDLQ